MKVFPGKDVVFLKTVDATFIIKFQRAHIKVDYTSKREKSMDGDNIRFLNNEFHHKEGITRDTSKEKERILFTNQSNIKRRRRMTWEKRNKIRESNQIQIITNRIELKMGNIQKERSLDGIGKEETYFKAVYTYRVIFQDFIDNITWFPKIGKGNSLKNNSDDIFYKTDV